MPAGPITPVCLSHPGDLYCYLEPSGFVITYSGDMCCVLRLVVEAREAAQHPQCTGSPMTKQPLP